MAAIRAPYPMAALVTITNSLNRLKPVVNSLAGPQERPVVRISIVARDHFPDSKRGVLKPEDPVIKDPFRLLTVTFGGSKPLKENYDMGTPDPSMPEVILAETSEWEQPVRIVFRRNIEIGGELPKVAETNFPGGIFQLLRQSERTLGPVAKTDEGVWLARVGIGLMPGAKADPNQATNGVLELRILWMNSAKALPVPSSAEWPKEVSFR
jgi:hypothetical protein